MVNINKWEEDAQGTQGAIIIETSAGLRRVRRILQEPLSSIIYRYGQDPESGGNAQPNYRLYALHTSFLGKKHGIEDVPNVEAEDYQYERVT
jgi:hypothetical protein